MFGFEHPHERECNEADGTDYESSHAVYIVAGSPEAALKWGQRLSCNFVRGLFHGDTDFWSPKNFANWIETSPEPTWDLSKIPEIVAGDENGLQALAQAWNEGDESK